MLEEARLLQSKLQPVPDTFMHSGIGFFTLEQLFFQIFYVGASFFLSSSKMPRFGSSCGCSTCQFSPCPSMPWTLSSGGTVGTIMCFGVENRPTGSWHSNIGVARRGKGAKLLAYLSFCTLRGVSQIKYCCSFEVKRFAPQKFWLATPLL